MLENEPPVGVNEKGSSPFEVCFVQPEVVIKPVIRGRLVELCMEENALYESSIER